MINARPTTTPVRHGVDEYEELGGLLRGEHSKHGHSSFRLTLCRAIRRSIEASCVLCQEIQSFRKSGEEVPVGQTG